MGNVIVNPALRRRIIQDVNVLHADLDITFLAMTTVMNTVPQGFVDLTRKFAMLLL